jgi:hypothetical protein
MEEKMESFELETKAQADMLSVLDRDIVHQSCSAAIADGYLISIQLISKGDELALQQVLTATADWVRYESDGSIKYDDPSKVVDLLYA